MIEEYIVVYCLPDTENLGNNIPMNSIQKLGLNSIILILARIAVQTSLHQESRPLMYYVVECMRPAIYDWSTSLLGNMKQQMTYFKIGRVRNFGFARILSTFFFEQVL